MRILYICDSKEYGGAEKYLSQLINGMAARGHEVYLLSSEKMAQQLKVTKGVSLIVCPFRQSILDLFLAQIVRRAIATTRPDIIHINIPFAYSSLTSAFIGAEYRAKIIATVHSYEMPASRFPLVGGFRKYAAFKMLAGISRFILVSDHSKQEFCDIYRIDPNHVSVVFNGLPDLKGPAKSENKPGNRIIGLVSRLVRGKGIDCFIQAASQLRAKQIKARFIIVGDGPLSEKMMKMNVGLEAGIEFAGYRSDAADSINGFDIAVFTSHSENMPYVVLEYMRAGKPIISTRVGGIPEMIREGEEGILIDPGDPDQLTQTILKLIREPALAQELGKNVRKRFLKEFTEDKVIDTISRVYNQII